MSAHDIEKPTWTRPRSVTTADDLTKTATRATKGSATPLSAAVPTQHRFKSPCTQGGQYKRGRNRPPLLFSRRPSRPAAESSASSRTVFRRRPSRLPDREGDHGPRGDPQNVSPLHLTPGGGRGQTGQGHPAGAGTDGRREREPTGRTAGRAGSWETGPGEDLVCARPDESRPSGGEEAR